SPVSLACPTNGILGITCSLSPNTVNLSNGTPATSVLTISTLGPSASNTISSTPLFDPPATPTPPIGWYWPMAIPPFSGALMAVNRQPKRLLAGVVRGVGFCLIVLIVGCGGGSSGGGGGGGGPVPSTITLTTSSVKIAAPGNITVTANVSSSKTPTGTVTFLLDGFPGTANAVNGVAQAPLTRLIVGNPTINA